MPIKVEFPRESSDGTPVFSAAPLEGSRKNFFTHNWCDPTTWYQGSKLVASEALTDQGDHKTFKPAASRPWIDVTHGKSFGEVDQASFAPEIQVDGQTKSENSPGTTDGDYSIDYSTGTVTFNVALAGSEVVTASYFYADSSLFIVAPSEGRLCRITEVKILFSKDIEMTDNLVFQVWAYDPENLPNKIPVSGAEVYKTILNFMQDANKVQPVVLKIGGENWRALTDDLLPMSFDYTATIDLFASYGMEIHVWLEHNTPFDGCMAYGTFYTLSSAEPEA